MKLIPLALAMMLAATAAAKPLVFCSEAAPQGFDYAMYTAATTNDAAAQTIYNRLVEFEPGGTKVIPALAEKWEISKDGLEYTFSLRRGVKFHTTEWFKPTRDFNADDVLWSFGRMLDSKHPGAGASPQGWPFAVDMGFPGLIKKLERVDDYTVKFVLNHQEAPFLADLAMAFSSIVSAEYAQKLLAEGRSANITTQPVGTGPYVFKRYEVGSQIRYEAHPAYWRGKAASDKLIFAITTDPAVRAQKLKRGECNFMVYPKPQDLPMLGSDPNLVVESNSALVLSYLAVNAQHKVTSDKRVRQALALAIDKPAIARAVYEGSAVPAHLPLPMAMWAYNKRIAAPARDLDKAKKLLQEAGYPNGLELSLYVRNSGGGTNPNPKLTAEMIQADWARIGVKAKIVVLEWVELLKRTKAGEHDVVLYGWAGDNGDPDNFLSPILSCTAAESGENRSRWCNKDFDKLIDAAKRTTNLAERTKLYEQAQQLFFDEMAWISLVEPKVMIARQKHVEGYKANPFMTNNFERVRVK
ncbi:ABC transporter substrate-binding protein [Chitinimonas sp.]|uniref:ABC transporter substrate-binding protein n=1 Tax=Chitinimonas sp. TaxID=1934313 RepID=UPI0035B43D0F